MALRILFLDDDPDRHRRIKPALLPDAAWTAAEAIAALRARPYDAAFLDHDLGGETFVDPAGDNTGSAVARFLAAERPPLRLVVVHSLNWPAAAGMAATLRGAGYRVLVVPFTALPDQADAIVAELEEEIAEEDTTLEGEAA